MLVLFDSCWDPLPKLGPQRAPMQGVHNSGWVQSPGAKALEDASQVPRLKSYVVGVVGAFANDPRILAWDVWNEPGGFQYGYYEQQEPKNKVQIVLGLLPQAFAWARSANPTQPLTSGLWEGDWPKSGPTPMEEIQLQELRHHHLPQLQLAGKLREPRGVAGEAAPPDHLHGIHGAFGGKYVRWRAAHREEAPCRRDQLGAGHGQDADQFSVGVMEPSLRSGPAAGVVSRCFQAQMGRRTGSTRWS